MKTTININELVAAFKAQANEELRQKREAEDARKSELRKSDEQKLAHLQAMWPQFEQAILALPDGKVVHAPLIHENGGVTAVFEMHYHTKRSSYRVSRTLTTNPTATEWRLGPGEHGGFLLIKKDELPWVSVENPADLLVLIASFAGREACRIEHGKL